MGYKLMNIQEWQLVAYNNACVHGFHTKPDGNPVDHTDPIRVASRLALIHSELSEALEEIATNKAALYYPAGNGKPEGIGIELADVMIRTFDLAESLGLKLEDPNVQDMLQPLTTADQKGCCIAQLHHILSFCFGSGDLEADLNLFKDCVFSFSFALGIDLWAMIEIKHEFNVTRPHRHGGKAL